MTNLFRQAKQLIETKTCGQFTDEDIELINRATFPLIIGLLADADEMPISEGLDRLARIVEETKGGGCQ